jgi:hypothetical protein
MARKGVPLLFVLATLFFLGEPGKVESGRPQIERQMPGSDRPQVFTASAAARSPRVSELAEDKYTGPAPDPLKHEDGPIALDKAVTDGADAAPFHFSSTPMPGPSLTFDGISNYDNLSTYGVLLSPPDMSGDVGPDHYVQAVNSLFRIYAKDGTPLIPPVRLSSLFAPLGTICSARNDGDPIVLYDPLADRWLISQYCTAFPPFRQMIAISQTRDPAGAYFIYEFVMPNVKLNDFPKFGVWPDAYYMSTEEFLGSEYTGAGAFAFDRMKMLSGDPSASYIYFDVPTNFAFRAGGLLPSDIDGLIPPQINSPNVFAGYSATEYGEPIDALRLFDFHADFDTPLASTFQERAESPLPVAAFDPTSPDGRADIAQMPPGAQLDSNSDRLMFRAAYRNFGDHNSLVLNQTVRVSGSAEPYQAGVRIYELQERGGQFEVADQATLTSPGYSRWIGTAAQDRAGNIAIGYNGASVEKPTSILYAGRLSTDPPGQYRNETVLAEGTGVQKAFGFRWGDYSTMSVDPSDDCTFWMTGEFYTAESEAFSDFGWLTKIGRFKFDECSPAPTGRLTVSVVNDHTGQPVAHAAVFLSPVGSQALAPFYRLTNENGSSGSMIVPFAVHELSVRADGFLEKKLNISAFEGSDTVTVRLDPTPYFEIVGSEISSESCSPDHSPEPGETVELNITLVNSGRINSRSLRAYLLPSDKISYIGPLINYGIILPGSRVTRPFRFTVSSSVYCGERIPLVFRLIDGRRKLDQTLWLRTGKRVTALTENFDTADPPALPAGWSSATVGTQPWSTSNVLSWSPMICAFSPALDVPGVNELVSPEFFINSKQAEISFQNRYDLETTFLRNRRYDGAVLEIKIGDADWKDIIAAGGDFEVGGYDGPLDNCCQNPLAGREAWSGKSGPNQIPEFVRSLIRLPSVATGHNVRLRWRVATDNGTSREGQFIDDVLVTDGYACNCTGLARRR